MIRAKFICQQNLPDRETKTATVILTPVTSNPPSEENLTFWQATPAGNITLQITNPAASSQFSVGTAYYVDFTAA
ncbi:MAG: hypothetical protein HWQ36_21235 [Nostoc sp. NMS2]|uniref:hypothetical protein n=1 Tax=Nostoc sp. NMS2 TaxID=2815389 RepID=UPI0025F11C73|nr:hypothetical protein [Nostoc sp. NMS2]MBN3990041.1 hypothetical protein [Nostoc sp. NMS2]MBN3992965.1 hypothetical protein [Nostoc sp. NMS2]